MGPETIIAMGAQTTPNFLIIKTERWSTIYRVPADVGTGAMHYNIGKNHMIYADISTINTVMKQKQNKYAGYVWRRPIESSIADD